MGDALSEAALMIVELIGGVVLSASVVGAGWLAAFFAIRAWRWLRGAA